MVVRRLVLSVDDNSDYCTRPDVKLKKCSLFALGKDGLVMFNETVHTHQNAYSDHFCASFFTGQLQCHNHFDCWLTRDAAVDLGKRFEASTEKCNSDEQKSHELKNASHL